MFYNNDRKSLFVDTLQQYIHTIEELEKYNTKKEIWLEKFRSLPLDERFFFSLTLVFLDKTINSFSSKNMNCNLSNNIVMQQLGGRLSHEFTRKELKSFLQEFNYYKEWERAEKALCDIGIMVVAYSEDDEDNKGKKKKKKDGDDNNNGDDGNNNDNDIVQLFINEDMYLSLLQKGAYMPGRDFLNMSKADCFYPPPFYMLIVEILYYYTQFRQFEIRKISKLLNLNEQICNFWVQRAIKKEQHWRDCGGGRSGNGVTISGDPLEMEITEEEAIARAAYFFNCVHRDFKLYGFDNLSIKDYLDTQNNYLKMKEGYEKLKKTRNPNEVADNLLRESAKGGMEEASRIYEEALAILEKRGVVNSSAGIDKGLGIIGNVNSGIDAGSKSNSRLLKDTVEYLEFKKKQEEWKKEDEEEKKKREEGAKRKEEERLKYGEDEEEEEDPDAVNNGFKIIVDDSITHDECCRVYVYDLDGKSIAKQEIFGRKEDMSVKMKMVHVRKDSHLQKILNKDGKETFGWVRNWPKGEKWEGK